MIDQIQNKEYFLCVFGTSFASILIGAFPLFRKNKSLALNTFCLFFICVALWSGTLTAHIYFSTNKSISTLTAQIMHYFVIWIPVFYLHSIDSLFDCGKKTTVKSAYFFGTLFTFANYFHMLVAESQPSIGFDYFLTLKVFYKYFLLYFLFYLLISYYLLIKAFRRGQGFEKNQIKIIIASTLVGHIGAMTNYFAAYGVWIYPINPYFTLLVIPYVGGIVYAILAFRLFDFNLIARWGIAYIILISLLVILVVVNSEILAFIGHIFGISKGIAYIFVSCMIVYLLEPLKNKIAKFVDLFIFRSPDFQKIISGIEADLKASESIEKLANNITGHLEKIWNTYHSGFVLWNVKSGIYDLYPKETFLDKAIDKFRNHLTPSDFLIKTLESERRLFKFGIIIDSEIESLSKRASAGEKITFSKISRTMRWLGASACIPLMHNQLMGFIVLGAKKSGGIFNDEDKKFLSHIAEIVTSKIIALMIKNNIYEGNQFIGEKIA